MRSSGSVIAALARERAVRPVTVTVSVLVRRSGAPVPRSTSPRLTSPSTRRVMVGGLTVRRYADPGGGRLGRQVGKDSVLLDSQALRPEHDLERAGEPRDGCRDSRRLAPHRVFFPASSDHGRLSLVNQEEFGQFVGTVTDAEHRAVRLKGERRR